MKIRFYNRDGRWYADLPSYIDAGGTEEECEMICGADTWLDKMSFGKSNLFIKLSLVPDWSSNKLPNKISLIEKDEYGATYKDILGDEMWLCSVTLFLFGEYPEIIYYEVI